MARWKAFIVAVGVVGLCAFWSGRALRAVAGGSFVEQRGKTAIGFPVTGYRPPFRKLLEPEVLQTDTQTLLFVVSDTCVGCGVELASWNTLLSRIPKSAPPQILIVSYQGSHFAEIIGQFAQAHGLNSRSVKPKIRDTFVVASGIASTPSTVLIGTDGSVRAVASSLTGASVEHVVSLLGGTSEK